MNKIKGKGIMSDSQFSNVVIQLTDHLFEQGHTITRPLIMDAAAFVRMYAESWYEQGRMRGHAEQLAKDSIEGVEQVKGGKDETN